jgi:hypothetical protein
MAASFFPPLSTQLHRLRALRHIPMHLSGCALPVAVGLSDAPAADLDLVMGSLLATRRSDVKW